MSETWYPRHNSYYAEAGLENIPVRQGDLLEAGSTCLDTRGKSWYGCVVVHPSCDIVTGKVNHIQVCRVRRLREQSKKYQEMIVAGQSTDDQGRARVAMAHTFFLPPARDDGPFSEPMFADFLDVAKYDRRDGCRTSGRPHLLTMLATASSADPSIGDSAGSLRWRTCRNLRGGGLVLILTSWDLVRRGLHRLCPDRNFVPLNWWSRA